jgi:uroporphyrinogen-III synthase
VQIKKILVSQPKPSSEKSPYYDIEKKYGVTIVFRPFFKVEGLSSKEFRQNKVSISDHTSVIFTARTAIDHYFRLCKELRFEVPDTMKYFCVSETVAHYLQKYIVYRKRKIFFSETGKIEDLIPAIVKHNKEKYLYPMSDVHDSKTSKLDENHINYTKAIMYRTVSNDFAPDEPFDYDMLIFFTPTGVKSMLKNFPKFKQGDIVIGGMGPKTLDEIKNSGLRLDITTSPEVPSMAAAIDQWLKDHQE